MCGVGRRTKTRVGTYARPKHQSLLTTTYARWRVPHVRVHPQRKSPAQVTQKVAHHHKQNTLRCHLHTLVCTISQMYNVHKKHNSAMTRQVIDEPRVSHRAAPHVNTSDRFSLYRQFKTLTGVQPYLMLNLNRHIRYTLTRFRSGVSDTKVHRSSFKVYNVDDLKCPLCVSTVDNEVHFVLCCPAFDDLRYEFIEHKILITHVNFGWHCS